MSVEDDLVKQVTLLQRQVDSLIIPEKTGDLISPFQALPGLVGFWPMSSVQRSTGNAADLGGQTRTLTYNGNPTYNIYNNVVPYLDLDGTGDFLSRVDETDLDILGTEAVFAAAVRGLTMGGWYWVDTLGGVSRGLIGKSNATGNQRSYELFISITDTISFLISNNGVTNNINNTNLVPSIVASPRWYFIIARFVPSTSQDIFINGTWYRYSITVPAAIFNSTANLELGSFNAGANALDGRLGPQFLCANALSEQLISSVFQQTRAYFNT